MNKHKARIAELESNLKTQSNTIKNQQKAMDKLKTMLNAANLQIDMLDDTIRMYEKKEKWSDTRTG